DTEGICRSDSAGQRRLATEHCDRLFAVADPVFVRADTCLDIWPVANQFAKSPHHAGCHPRGTGRAIERAESLVVQASATDAATEPRTVESQEAVRNGRGSDSGRAGKLLPGKLAGSSDGAV